MRYPCLIHRFSSISPRRPSLSSLCFVFFPAQYGIPCPVARIQRRMNFAPELITSALDGKLLDPVFVPRRADSSVQAHQRKHRHGGPLWLPVPPACRQGISRCVFYDWRGWDRVSLHALVQRLRIPCMSSLLRGSLFSFRDGRNGASSSFSVSASPASDRSGTCLCYPDRPQRSASSVSPPRGPSSLVSAETDCKCTAGPLIPSFMSYIVGLVFYATHLPERLLAPRWRQHLDFFGAGSHAIWHVFIVLAISQHKSGIESMRTGMAGGCH
jgi:hypothetical protein